MATSNIIANQEAEFKLLWKLPYDPRAISRTNIFHGDLGPPFQRKLPNYNDSTWMATSNIIANQEAEFKLLSWKLSSKAMIQEPSPEQIFMEIWAPIS